MMRRDRRIIVMDFVILLLQSRGEEADDDDDSERRPSSDHGADDEMRVFVRLGRLHHRVESVSHAIGAMRDSHTLDKNTLQETRI